MANNNNTQPTLATLTGAFAAYGWTLTLRTENGEALTDNAGKVFTYYTYTLGALRVAFAVTESGSAAAELSPTMRLTDSMGDLVLPLREGLETAIADYAAA